MYTVPIRSRSLTMRSVVVALSALQVFTGLPIQAAPLNPSRETRTPIKHVIVIIGENRTFDHVFATYKPTTGQKVSNLLSKGIVNEDGTLGPNYSLAAQYSAEDTATDLYQLSPGGKALYPTLPVPLAGGPAVPYVPTLAEAEAVETGLPDTTYYTYLTTGGTGLKAGTPDTRIPNVNNLPDGPFQITPGIPYDGYAASPVHRFYQMWQQLDCKLSAATRSNPSGCRADLFPWVETTIGAGSNGKAQPIPFTEESTGEGSTAMGFYNMLQGDAPYLKYLADNFAMSDNYHHRPSTEEQARIMLRWAQATPSILATPKEIQLSLHTTSLSIRARRMRAWWTRSKTPTRPRARITGTAKTVTGAALTGRRHTAEAPIAIALT
jgi:phospholipase C